MCSSIELLSWTVLFAAETLAIIAGNIITVIVFWKMRSDFKKTYYLLINLSIADLTVGISALEITISKIWNLAISQNIFLKKFLALYPIHTSKTFFYAITYPLNHRTLTKRVYVHGVLWPWACGMLVALISFSPELLPDSAFPLVAPLILTSLAVIGVLAVSILYTFI
ncbi:unnamed protein product [Pocillopora meandrina]|uniref:G-protein coupled receptors family 1 profile domain-containing protein n=1 Tax=Pocillopora meandrina TaxID=46732 RepID=A0AAU9WKR1_9CNID|nr:unnamed protein product [Pocillopora meandrina]